MRNDNLDNTCFITRFIIIQQKLDWCKKQKDNWLMSLGSKELSFWL